jgi:hypothetical protein
MIVNKLAELFSARHADLWRRLEPSMNAGSLVRMQYAWYNYLNGLDCTVIDKDDILEDFESIVNSSAQGRVCVYDKNYKDYILVPKELARKAVVLGGLPDSWFPEG